MPGKLVDNLTNKPGLMAPGLSEVILQGCAGVKLLLDMVISRSACQLPDGAADSLLIAASLQLMGFGNEEPLPLEKANTVHRIGKQVGLA